MNIYLFRAVNGEKTKRVEIFARDYEEACEKMQCWIEDHGYKSYYEISFDE